MATPFIITLKKPLIVQTVHPMDSKRQFNKRIKAVRVVESIGEMRACADVCWEEDGNLNWFNDYFGQSDAPTIFRLTIPDSNIEGTQLL